MKNNNESNEDTSCLLWIIILMLGFILTGLSNKESKGSDIEVHPSGFPDKATAQRYANHADNMKTQLLTFWKGKDSDLKWIKPVQIHYKEGPASGLTSFITKEKGVGHCNAFTIDIAGTNSDIMIDVIPHEMDHVIRHSLYKKTSVRWLDEGIASLFEGQVSHNRLRSVNKAEAYKCLLHNFDSKNYPSQGRQVTLLYGGGFNLVEYLLTLKGRKTLLAFAGDTKLPSQKVLAYYQKSKERLLHDWYEWTKKKTGTDCITSNCVMHNNRPLTTGRTSLRPPRGLRKIYFVSPKWFCYYCNVFNARLKDRRFLKALEEAGFIVEHHYIESHPEWNKQYNIPPSDKGRFPLFIIPSSGEYWLGYTSSRKFLLTLQKSKAYIEGKSLAQGLPISEEEKLPPPLTGEDPFLLPENAKPLTVKEPVDAKEIKETSSTLEEPSLDKRVITPSPKSNSASTGKGSKVLDLAKSGGFYLLDKLMVAKLGFGLAGPVGLGVGAGLTGLGWLWRRRRKKKNEKKLIPYYQSNEPIEFNLPEDDSPDTYDTPNTIPIAASPDLPDSKILEILDKLNKITERVKTVDSKASGTIDYLADLEKKRLSLQELLNDAKGITQKQTLSKDGKTYEPTYWKEGIKLAESNSPNISVIGGPNVAKGITRWVYEQQAKNNGTHLDSK